MFMPIYKIVQLVLINLCPHRLALLVWKCISDTVIFLETLLIFSMNYFYYLDMFVLLSNLFNLLIIHLYVKH